MSKLKNFLIISIASVFMLNVIPTYHQIETVEAHAGRTDSQGGHRDNKNKSGLGAYHYHCNGHPAHLHTNGICPYSSAVTGGESSSAEASAAAASVYVGKYKYAWDEYTRRLANNEFNPDILEAMSQDTNALTNNVSQVMNQEELNYAMNATNEQDEDDVVALAFIRVYDLMVAQLNSNPGQSAANITNTYDSVIFSANYYAAKYPELVAALGNNPEVLYQHFIQSGMAEGRQGAATFNIQVYMTNNPDLAQVLGNNLPAYYEHYLNAGQYEGRVAY